MSKQICVIGGGRWGENHIRTLHEMGNLGAVVDLNAQRLRELNRFIRDEKPEMEDELPVRERIGFAAEGTVE